jgi:adenosyl cobinamide kinase/adenosyl cobinamide phosphate guanylyltransferase
MLQPVEKPEPPAFEPPATSLHSAIPPTRAGPQIVPHAPQTTLVLGGHDIEAAITGLEAALSRRTHPTILVNNEVGLGIVPDTRLGRSFRDQAGRLNQRLAEQADHVVFMIAGLPMTLK